MKAAAIALLLAAVLGCTRSGPVHGSAAITAEFFPASASATWAHAQIRVADAWFDEAPPRNGPVVAVLDTGVTPVSDLDGALVPGFDGIGGGETNDENGHGTAVASLIAGRHDGVGADGICPSCRIMPLKIAGADGRSPDAAQAAAINWAVDHGADLLSISFVGLDPGGPVGDAITAAVARGVTVVAAAGNESTYDRRWPAAYDQVLGVGATDESGGLAGFSNRGSTWVDVVAPGCANSMNPQQQTVLFCGTSVSTPLAAGTLALLKSLAPQTPYATLVTTLERTAQPVGGDVAQFGRLDVGAAMRDLGLSPVVTTAPAPVVSRTSRLLASHQAKARAKKAGRVKRHWPVPVPQ
jgi:subtilisin family serine protease